MKRANYLTTNAVVGVSALGTFFSQPAEAKDDFAKLFNRNAHKIEDSVIAKEKWEDISNYAIVKSRETLGLMTSPDVYLKLSAEQVGKMRNAVIADLKKNQKIEDSGMTINDGTDINLASQAIVVLIDADFSLKAVSANLQLEIALAIRTESNRVFVDPYIKEIKVKKLELGNLNVEKALPLVNKALQAMKEGLRDTVNTQFGPIYKTMIVPAPQVSNLRELSAGNVELKDRPVKYIPNLDEIAFMIDENGIYGIADISNLDKLPNRTETPPTLPTYPHVSEEQRDAAFVSYSNAFREKLSQNAALTTNDNYTLAVSKSYLAGSVNKILEGDPIAGRVTISEIDKPYKTDVRPTSQVDLNCEKSYDDCGYQNLCKQPKACETTVAMTEKQVVKESCKIYTCLKFGPLGCLLKGWRDKICNKVVDVTRLVTKPIDSPACKAFHAYGSINPAACVIANNLSKAQCDVFREVGVAACLGEQSFNNALAGVKIGELSGKVSIAGWQDLLLDGVNIQNDFKTVSALVSGKGNATIDGTVGFNLDPAKIGVLSCLALATKVGGNVSTNLEREGAKIVQTEENNTDKGLSMHYEIDQDVKVRLEQSPVTVLRNSLNDAKISCNRTELPFRFLGINISALNSIAALEPFTNAFLKIPRSVKAGFNVNVKSVSLPVAKTKIQLKPSSAAKVFVFNPS